MNWSKAKTILIIFFLVMNIFLVCNIIYSTSKSTAITPEILNSTVEVLAKNDITIDPDIIPHKTSSLPYVEVNNIITSGEEFAKKLLGNDYTISENKYTNKTSTLTLNGDNFIFTSTTPLFSDITAGIDENTAKKTALNILEQLSLSLDKYTCSVTQKNNHYEVVFAKKLKSNPVFGSEITMLINSKGLTHISGAWFNESPASGMFSEKISLNPITSILVEFILNDERPKDAITITDLDLGYYIGNDGIYHKSIALTPVWKIVLSDNSCYYVDARESR